MELNENLNFPIVVYGKSGNGKTYLMKSIAESYTNNGKNALILNADDFIAHLIGYLRKKESPLERFWQKFLDVDLVIFEDIQFLEFKTSTQMLLSDLIEKLLAEGKQVLCTMNRSPKKLECFDKKLETKLANATRIHILPPSKSIKKKLLKQWCRENNLTIQKKHQKKICKHAKSTGELLGFLKQYQFYREYDEFTSNKKIIKTILKKRKMVEE